MLLTDIEQVFDSLLRDVAAGRRTSAECVMYCEQRYPSLVSSLKLALAMSSISPDDAELDAARANIWRNLDMMLDAEVEPSVTPHLLPSRPAPMYRPTWRIAALCAAVLAILLMATGMLSVASSDALPESPLYFVKRANENIQLQMAWSDQMRAEVLAQIARHRLDEANAEAALHHTNQAVLLIDECNQSTGQLVNLVIAMHQNRQDDKTVTDALTTTLRAEYDALTLASNNGQSALAQALSNGMADQQGTLVASNIVLPPLNAPQATSTVVAHPTHVAHPTATTIPTQPPAATPTVTPTPDQNSDGSGNGNGKGSGNGNDSGSGKGLNGSSGLPANKYAHGRY